MTLHHRQCFVIADGGRARFVKPAHDNALHTQQAVESVSLHKKSHDLGTDQPGRAFESASVTRHAIAPKHDPHEMEKLKFARLVAERISIGADADDFNELVLVAPAPMLAEIQDGLTGAARQRLCGTLAKDLVNVPDDQLWPHLKQWVEPTDRA